MQEKTYKQLKKRVEDIEKKYQSLENFVLNSTKLTDEHKMRMEEDYSFILKEIEQVYQELSDLELADLLDFENLIGRSDGKFG